MPLGEAADDPVEVTDAIVGQDDRKGDVLADNGLKGDRGIFREQVEMKEKGPGNSLLDVTEFENVSLFSVALLINRSSQLDSPSQSLRHGPSCHPGERQAGHRS